jgi:hypothetical protein
MLSQFYQTAVLTTLIFLRYVLILYTLLTLTKALPFRKFVPAFKLHVQTNPFVTY